MAEIIYTPDQHSCLDELEELGKQPVGTVAKCSCGTRYVMREAQFDGRYWHRIQCR